MSKALVTGGAGFVGSHIVDRLVNDGHEVIILDNFSTGKRENINPKAKLVECDIVDFKSIEQHFQGVDVVFHTAALARIAPSVKNPLPANENNVTGTLNVLWATKRKGINSKLIFCGSSSIYGKQDSMPLHEAMAPHCYSPYALQKFIGEQYCQLFSSLYGLDTVILRYFNVYGSRQLSEGAYSTVIGIFLHQRARGEPMTVVSDAWDRKRDYTYISDVVEANMLAWKTQVPRDNNVFNIGTNENFTVKQVTELIGGPTVEIEERPWEYHETLADNTKAKNILGWSPKMKFTDGIVELKKLYGLK